MKRRLICLLAFIVPLHFALAQGFNSFPTLEPPSPSWNFGQSGTKKDSKEKLELDLTLGYAGMVGDKFSSMLFMQYRYTLSSGLHFMTDGGIAIGEEGVDAYEAMCGIGYRVLNKKIFYVATSFVVGYAGQKINSSKHSTSYYSDGYYSTYDNTVYGNSVSYGNSFNDGFLLGADAYMLIKPVNNIGVSLDVMLGLLGSDSMIFMPKAGVTFYF